mgnify:FL=1
MKAIVAAEKFDVQNAIDFGNKAIQMYEQMNIQTIEDAVAINVTIGGIPVPELMHEGVIKARLRSYRIIL